MSNNKKFNIPKELLIQLEEKITKRVLENVEKIVAQKCEIVFQQNCSASLKDEFAFLPQEIESLKTSLASFRKNLESLTVKTDHIIGSVAYIADEYDEFRSKISETSGLLQDISKLQLSTNKLTARQDSIEFQLDRLEQYGRRENLEIHGVPVAQNENTNQIVKNVASLLNVQLDNSHISTSHRMPVSEKSAKLRPKENNNKHPPIIVRFSNRDKRNELFAKRKMLKMNRTNTNSAFNHLHVSLQENLTAYRKMLYNEAKNAQHALNFKFLWTSQGQIRMRRNSDSSVLNVNSLSDLTRLGYIGPGRGPKFYKS